MVEHVLCITIRNMKMHVYVLALCLYILRCVKWWYCGYGYVLVRPVTITVIIITVIKKV